MSTPAPIQARQYFDKVLTEREFQQAVVNAARICGCTMYHTWRSDHSSKGFPDLVLCKAGRLIFAELKTEKGKLSPDQEHWLAKLNEVAEATKFFAGFGVPVVRVFTWRPSDWPAIEKALTS